MARALLLTVGTGTVDQIESTLLTPIGKSIGEGAWDRVVLLPSPETADNAEKVRARMAEHPIAISALPKAGLEDNADACFDHFDRTIEGLIGEGFAPGDILVDFTRGTKAMSAALVLAAARHGLPRLRYVTGDRRDERGMVVAGSETLREVSAAAVEARRTLDLARGLAEHGAFTAALSLLPDPESPLAGLLPAADREAVAAACRLLRWLAAWDRLDYGSAVESGPGEKGALPPAWRRFAPPRPVTAHVRGLANRAAAASEPGRRAAWLRALAKDLLANAERAFASGRYEDALVRAYRLTELVGEARLLGHGIDSAGLTPAQQRRFAPVPGSAEPGGKRRPGPARLSRAQAVDLLERLGDPLAPTLRALDGAHTELVPEQRNRSILIHGHEAQGARQPDAWRRLLDSLERLLRRDSEQEPKAFADALAAARFPGRWEFP